MIINKAIHYYSSYNINDFIRKCIFKLLQLKSTYTTRFFKKIYYFKNSHIILGRNVRTEGFTPDIQVGNKTNIYDNCIFVISSHNAKLSIGVHCVLSYGVLVACHEEISIGDNVLIGEYSSIRDTTHNYSDLSVPMMFSGDSSKKISIHSDVWIGRGCIILPGTTIQKGAVIGANSVVSGNIESYGIYAGSPARLIKKRSEQK